MGTQPSNASFPVVSVAAPASPNEQGGQKSPESKTCTAAAAGGRVGSLMSLNSEEFQFRTGERFLVGNDTEQQKCRRRGESLPAMAFADELFADGVVMPLKLPPRLRCTEFTSFSKSSQVSLPKSPRTLWRRPFGSSSWNDDFDPFMAALNKVRQEENRGNNGHHRRSRSHSPFMAVPRRYINNFTDHCSEDVAKANSLEKSMQVTSPRQNGPPELSSSLYANSVQVQTREAPNPTSLLKGFFSRKRIGSTKIQDSPDKANSPVERRTKSSSKKNEINKVQNLKGFLLRYASFGREDRDRQLNKAKACSETRR